MRFCYHTAHIETADNMGYVKVYSLTTGEQQLITFTFACDFISLVNQCLGSTSWLYKIVWYCDHPIHFFTCTPTMCREMLISPQCWSVCSFKQHLPNVVWSAFPIYRFLGDLLNLNRQNYHTNPSYPLAMSQPIPI